MLFFLAHVGHWAVNLLYAAPMAIIGGVLWYASRRERLAGEGADEVWDGQDDPQWNDDPRLRDDA